MTMVPTPDADAAIVIDEKNIDSVYAMLKHFRDFTPGISMVFTQSNPALRSQLFSFAAQLGLLPVSETARSTRVFKGGVTGSDSTVVVPTTGSGSTPKFGFSFEKNPTLGVHDEPRRRAGTFTSFRNQQLAPNIEQIRGQYPGGSFIAGMKGLDGTQSTELAPLSPSNSVLTDVNSRPRSVTAPVYTSPGVGGEVVRVTLRCPKGPDGTGGIYSRAPVSYSRTKELVPS